MNKSAYDQFALEYRDYADGPNPTHTPAIEFGNQNFMVADKSTWHVIDRQIEALAIRRPGEMLRILDAGCGPGTWTMRIIHKLRERGLSAEVIAYDLSESMVDATRSAYEKYCQDQGRPTDVAFQVSVKDVREASADGFNLAFCLYTVLNHLQKDDLEHALKHLLQADCVVASLKGPYSPPTAYVIHMNQTIAARRDPASGNLRVVTRGGEFFEIPSHLYPFDFIRRTVEMNGAQVTEALGLDVITGRLAPDPNFSEHASGWTTPNSLQSLERELSTRSDFLDYAGHYMFVATQTVGSKS